VDYYVWGSPAQISQPGELPLATKSRYEAELDTDLMRVTITTTDRIERTSWKDPIRLSIFFYGTDTLRFLVRPKMYWGSETKYSLATPILGYGGLIQEQGVTPPSHLDESNPDAVVSQLDTVSINFIPMVSGLIFAYIVILPMSFHAETVRIVSFNGQNTMPCSFVSFYYLCRNEAYDTPGTKTLEMTQFSNPTAEEQQILQILVYQLNNSPTLGDDNSSPNLPDRVLLLLSSSTRSAATTLLGATPPVSFPDRMEFPRPIPLWRGGSLTDVIVEGRGIKFVTSGARYPSLSERLPVFNMENELRVSMDGQLFSTVFDNISDGIVFRRSPFGYIPTARLLSQVTISQVEFWTEHWLGDELRFYVVGQDGYIVHQGVITVNMHNAYLTTEPRLEVAGARIAGATLSMLYRMSTDIQYTGRSDWYLQLSGSRNVFMILSVSPGTYNMNLLQPRFVEGTPTEGVSLGSGIDPPFPQFDEAEGIFSLTMLIECKDVGYPYPCTTNQATFTCMKLSHSEHTWFMARYLQDAQMTWHSHVLCLLNPSEYIRVTRLCSLYLRSPYIQTDPYPDDPMQLLQGNPAQNVPQITNLDDLSLIHSVKIYANVNPDVKRLLDIRENYVSYLNSLLTDDYHSMVLRGFHRPHMARYQLPPKRPFLLATHPPESDIQEELKPEQGLQAYEIPIANPTMIKEALKEIGLEAHDQDGWWLETTHFAEQTVTFQYDAIPAEQRDLAARLVALCRLPIINQTVLTPGTRIRFSYPSYVRIPATHALSSVGLQRSGNSPAYFTLYTHVNLDTDQQYVTSFESEVVTSLFDRVSISPQQCGLSDMWTTKGRQGLSALITVPAMAITLSEPDMYQTLVSPEELKEMYERPALQLVISDAAAKPLYALPAPLTFSCQISLNARQ